MSNPKLSFHLLILIPLLAGCRIGAPASCEGPVAVRSAEDAAALQGCNAIDGDLLITGHGVDDLRGLERIRSVRYLVVVDTRLTDLAGLAGLREVEGISLHANAALVSLRGLENVRSLSGLVVAGHESLLTLDGLQGLERAHELVLSANPRLGSLAALSSLVSVRELEVSPATSDLDSFRGRTATPVALVNP